MVGGRVDHEAAPAAADVEHALVLPQHELPADQLPFGLLRLLERRRAPLLWRMGSPRVLERVELAGEQRAAIGHRLVEEQCEEVVGDVVVVAHRARVALAAVAPSPRAQLTGRDARRCRQSAGARGGKRQAQARPGVDWGCFERVEQPDHTVQIVHFELAGGVGASQPELSGSAQQVGDGGRGAHREDGSSGGGRRQFGSVPEAQRERALGERRGQLAAQRLRLGERHSRLHGVVVYRCGSSVCGLRDS